MSKYPLVLYRYSFVRAVGRVECAWPKFDCDTPDQQCDGQGRTYQSYETQRMSKKH